MSILLDFLYLALIIMLIASAFAIVEFCVRR